MNSATPWRRQWAMMCSMNGRPATLSRGLGVSLASAPRRVAIPPARMTAWRGNPPRRTPGASSAMRRYLVEANLVGFARHVAQQNVHVSEFKRGHVEADHQQRMPPNLTIRRVEH